MCISLLLGCLCVNVMRLTLLVCFGSGVLHVGAPLREAHDAGDVPEREVLVVDGPNRIV